MKSPNRLRHFLWKSTAFFALSALPVGAAGGENTIDSKNLTVLGFVLGDDEVGIVESRLGEARVSHAPEHGMTQRCYQSMGADRTVLVFEDWSGTLSGFRLYRPAASNRLCTKTSLVTSDISTASGLKLGLGKHAVLQILGKPTKIVGDTFIYKDESKKGRATEDAQLKKEHPEDTSDLQIWNFTEIKLLFRNSKLSSIDVVHTETT